MIPFLDEYFGRRAPALPPNVKELLVQFGGWIAVGILLLSIPLLTLVIGLQPHYVSVGGVNYAYDYGDAPRFSYFALTIGVVAHFVLLAMAVRGLFGRKMPAWRLAFYAQAARALGSILSGAVVGGLLAGLISFYFLFQVRPLYKN